MFNDATQKAKISIGNIFAILFGIAVIGICSAAVVSSFSLEKFREANGFDRLAAGEPKAAREE